MRIVDSHHHLWRRADTPREGILAAPYLDRDVSWADFEAAWDGLDVAASVFVQVRDDEDEVGYVAGVAEAHPDLRAMIPWAPLERPDAGDVIGRLRRHPLVRGVRRNTQGEADPAFVARPEYVRGVRLLGEAGLICELCVRHEQIEAVPRLARACPETAIVVQHLGKPDVEAAPSPLWLRAVEELGALRNVHCKVSPVVHTDHDPAPGRGALAPYVDHLLATLGPGRLLFGSNWPVSTAVIGYRAWVELVEGLLAGLGAAEREAVFAANAERLYAVE